jgi:hypothetical protein
VFAAGVALADDRYGSGVDRGMPGGATSGTSAPAGFMGQHTMTGTVKKVDKEAGKVSIEADGKDLDLHFPQSVLESLNTGDRVQVQLAIKKASGTTTPGADRPTSGTGGGMR